MNDHSRQALVADIGGTFMSFAVADIDELTISHFALLSSADFKRPMDAVERYLKSLPSVPDKASFAVAGEVAADGCTMTFRPWTITKKDIRAATGCEWVTLLNDLDALALSLPHLTDYELIEIAKGEHVRYGNRVVINAGTGLGIAGLMWSGDHWLPVHGEGGRVAFPAPAADEFDVRKAFASDFVSAEQVFCGQGLVALYNALARDRGETAPALSAPQINRLGASGEDPIAAEAINLMGIWFARFAGDVALTFGARGGVYLGGGLSAGVVPAIDRQHFLAAFRAKGESSGYAAAMPVHVVKTGADAGLRGAAVALARALPAGVSAGRRASTA
jgi:glucokinase